MLPVHLSVLNILHPKGYLQRQLHFVLLKGVLAQVFFLFIGKSFTGQKGAFSAERVHENNKRIDGCDVQLTALSNKIYINFYLNQGHVAQFRICKCVLKNTFVKFYGPL